MKEHRNGERLESYFAPAERKGKSELERDIAIITASPVIGAIMTVASGLLAVLNEQRQVVALNNAFLQQIGIEDAAESLGLRLGEALKCRHACEMEGGCGTSEYCSTCGAVIATVAALDTGLPQERTCALALEKEGWQGAIYFSVRTYPLELERQKYLLLFMQDITMQQHRACLDRTFFHDINNMLCGLIGKSRVSATQVVAKERMEDIQHLVKRIAQEIAIHNSLQKSLDASYRPIYAQVTANSLLNEIERLFDGHDLAARKKLVVEYASPELLFTTDFHLTSRVIINMVTNALEATADGGEVVLSCREEEGAVTFRVRNPGEIPADVARRIFQLNFSTKATIGRGFGTYSMKLFGEQILGGKVSFDSTSRGTTFSLALPAR
ncbi:sensor histidine kinase [Geomonas sp. RF6]|uniref:sensor histidine kinase n=1 Tax=Geomonas sp. RF6 TaxID=2897342 RepID=UPI001E57BC9A|nr:sensor histidine kinase [Geomonas sp. RF6]UFS68941.1 sensor histidine kinase [Geomonas sp. RF6]